MKLLDSLKNSNRKRKTIWVDGHAKDLAVLNEFSALKELRLYRVSKKNIQVLRELNLPNLETLTIRLATFPDLTSIAHIQSITTLVVWQCSKLRSLAGLGSIGQLRELGLMQNGPIEKLDPIAALGNLEKLTLNGGLFVNQKASSFAPIGRLGKKLKLLDLTRVRLENPDLRPLTLLPEPDEFGISARFYPLEQIAMLAAAFPKWGHQLLHLEENPYSKCKKCGGPKLVLFKARSRDACPHCDKERLEKFFSEFHGLVDQ